MEGLCDTPAEITFCNTQNVAEPIWTWSPSIAPAGIDFYRNPAIPEWNNSLLVAVLKGKRLIQLKLNEDGTQITQQNIYLPNTYGRLRDVLSIPDGRLFLCTSNKDYAGTPGAGDDKIIELKNPGALRTVNFGADQTVVYPVPSDDLLFIEPDARMALVSILNLQGKAVYSGKFSEKVDVSRLASGVYILQLMDSGGQLLRQKKILIK